MSPTTIHITPACTEPIRPLTPLVIPVAILRPASSWHCPPPETCPACPAVNTIHQTAGPLGLLTYCLACGWEYLDPAARIATTPPDYSKGDWVGNIHLGTD